MPKYILLLFCLFTVAFSVKGQETIVSGKVTDSETGDPIPFANVYFLGTEIGITTNFDGLYRFKTTSPVDSLVVSYIGFNRKNREIINGKEQVINFQLQVQYSKRNQKRFNPKNII